MAVASSLQTMPSQIERMVPASQPSMHCGPPMAAMMRGMVTNGPNPTMLVMLSAVDSSRPNPRTRPYLFLISWCWSVTVLRLRARYCETRSSFDRSGWILKRYRPAFAIRTLCRCRRRHGLPAIEPVHFWFAIGKNRTHEIAHFVQVAIGKAYQEVIHDIGSGARRRQHHFGRLLQITQHDGALRADDLGADVVSINRLHVVFDRPECPTRKLQVHHSGIDVVELRGFREH